MHRGRGWGFLEGWEGPQWQAGGHRQGAGGPRGPWSPHAPFGGFPRWFFGRGTRVRRGDVRAGILALLAEQPRNGYQIMQELEQRSRGAWRPSPGSVYPALAQLEDEGLVRAKEGEGGGRIFELTPAGRRHVDERGEKAPWETMADEAGGDPLEIAQLMKGIAMPAFQVLHSGTPEQVAEVRKVLTEARRALFRILAADEDPDE